MKKSKGITVLSFIMIFTLLLSSTVFARNLNNAPNKNNITYISDGVDNVGSYKLYKVKATTNTFSLFASNSIYAEFYKIYDGHVSERFISKSYWYSENGYSGYLPLADWNWSYDNTNNYAPITYVHYEGYLYK